MKYNLIVKWNVLDHSEMNIKKYFPNKSEM